METKKSKYDTNPLDPDVERKAADVWGNLGGSAPTQQVGGATRDVGDSANEEARKNVYSEAPTRRYDNPPLEAPYPSIFVPPPYSPPAQYQSRQNIYQPPVSAIPGSRKVSGIGVSEKWALMLPYAPYIGLVVSLFELFLAPRREVKVRFHASQALAIHIAYVIGTILFDAIGWISRSSAGGTLFRIAFFVFLVISMIRVGKGDPHQIDAVAEPARWFNRHIEPRDKT